MANRIALSRLVEVEALKDGRQTESNQLRFLRLVKFMREWEHGEIAVTPRQVERFIRRSDALARRMKMTARKMRRLIRDVAKFGVKVEELKELRSTYTNAG